MVRAAAVNQASILAGLVGDAETGKARSKTKSTDGEVMQKFVRTGGGYRERGNKTYIPEVCPQEPICRDGCANGESRCCRKPTGGLEIDAVHFLGLFCGNSEDGWGTPSLPTMGAVALFAVSGRLAYDFFGWSGCLPVVAAGMASIYLVEGWVYRLREEREKKERGPGLRPGKGDEDRWPSS